MRAVARQLSRRKQTRAKTDFKEDMIYLEGTVVGTLPGVRFTVRIDRPNNLEPLHIDCGVKTLFKLRKIKIIKGDSVIVELDPRDLSQGVIVERK